MANIRCYSCMKEFDSKYDICPHCGYVMSSPPAVAYHLKAGTILQNRYVIGAVIGHGGFGVTYHAWDTTLNIHVAIKEFFPTGLVTRTPGTTDLIVFSGDKASMYEQRLSHFIEEAQNTVCFNTNPNIVNVYTYFEENNTAYYVMEYLEGLDLIHYLKQAEYTKINEHGILPIEDAIEITATVCDALTAVHQKEIIHRDVNPNNIRLCTVGIKLFDFGLARISDNEFERTREIELTPGYAPPEQYSAKSIQGPWTDVYSLSATLYRILTGVRPQDSLDRMADDQLQPPSQLNPEIPNWLQTVILNGMALESEFRFQTAEEFKNALIAGSVLKLPEEKIKKKKKTRLALIVSSLCAAIAIASGTYLYYQNNKTVTIDPNTKLVIEVPEDRLSLYESVYKDYFSSAYPEESKNINISFTTNTDVPSVYLYGTHKEILPLDTKEFYEDYINLSNYYLLSENLNSLNSKRIIPTGFYEVSAYINNQTDNDCVNLDTNTIDMKKLSEISDLQCDDRLSSIIQGNDSIHYSSIDLLSEKFSLFEYDTCISSNEMVNLILEVCQEHNNDDSTITINYDIYPIYDSGLAQGYWADSFCISSSLSKSQQAAAMLWSEFLLLEGVEERLFVSGSESIAAIPLQKNAFSQYIEYSSDKLSFIEQDINNIRIVELEVE